MAVFISYSHKDREIADKISTTLRRAQIEVIWDKTGLFGGEHLFQKLEGMIMAVDCILAVVSENSLPRRWLQPNLNLHATSV